MNNQSVLDACVQFAESLHVAGGKPVDLTVAVSQSVLDALHRNYAQPKEQIVLADGTPLTKPNGPMKIYANGSTIKLILEDSQ